jgi:hypothetical protein
MGGSTSAGALSGWAKPGLDLLKLSPDRIKNINPAHDPNRAVYKLEGKFEFVPGCASPGDHLMSGNPLARTGRKPHTPVQVTGSSREFRKGAHRNPEGLGRWRTDGFGIFSRTR